MEITKQLCKQKAKEKLLKFDGVAEEYETIIHKILYKAEVGDLDLLYYVTDVKMPKNNSDDYRLVIYETVLKILEIDEFEVTRYTFVAREDKFVNIGWRK